MRTKGLEVQGNGDKTLSIFDQPKDIKGTAFLTHAHSEKANDQWIYLPAIKRVKRINSRSKSGPFMGSEFSYEDIGSTEVSKYDYNYLRSETINGEDCYVLEAIPRDKDSGYTRTVHWLDKAHFRAQRIDFYDRKKTLLKTLTLSNYKLYLKK